MTTPTLHPYRNLLVELTDELEREGNDYRRRADDDGLGFSGNRAYLRGAQDAHANIVGRLRAVLQWHLTAVIDFAELYDDLEPRLRERGATIAELEVEGGPFIRPEDVIHVLAKVVDRYRIGGTR